jgi:hypothetical protein
MHLTTAIQKNKLRLLSTLLVVLAITGYAFLKKEPDIDFSTQVKPIINQKCIVCHGGVKAKNNFSLLFREDLFQKTKSGKPAIIPGDPDHSEMIKRLLTDDPDERMPYKHAPLSEAEIDILKKWIKQGAKWGEHWAYIPVKEVAVPQSSSSWQFWKGKNDWAKNEIDHFIEEKLNEQDIKPSAAADKGTLLRRLSLDIIGMPAPEKIQHDFLNNNQPDAYDKLVDSLLASPHYGEKWTSMWLDLARYADTKGYERDDRRQIWQYRDWLIKAFNADKPYDQFLTEQIAGDLMPHATDEQYIATAFHRNTMTNDEGGTDNEEFRTAAVIDRVNTTWATMLGTTFACVQCHSHPYDPFKMDEYYKFMAFFNNTRDEDTEADYPLLRSLNDSMQQELASINAWVKKYSDEQHADEVTTFIKTWQPSYNSLKCDSFINADLADTKWASFRNHSSCRLKDVFLSGKDQLLLRYRAMIEGGLLNIHLDSLKGKKLASISLPISKGWQMMEISIPPAAGNHDLFFSYQNPRLNSSPDREGAMIDWLAFNNQFPGKNEPAYAAEKQKYWQLLNATVPTTPVMVENPKGMRRPTYVFDRGNWMAHGEKVEPDVPHSLNPFPKNAPRNRLGLAMWLTSKQNPLTARTIVNRIWEQLFGQGLVETLEDLGTQGSPPSHPELLDWLSYQLMYKDNWSVKKLIRRIVMSATYQQQSLVTADLLEKDPNNIYYGRFGRHRLSAEQIRDQALCISGIMNEDMYGPSVMPWQPAGIWLSPWNGDNWKDSEGKNQYRRALYTYWKRTAPYPSMMAFDAVSREVCSTKRVRTNTPLQALTTLNDSAFIDIASQFARRMRELSGDDPAKQIEKGYELATLHPIGNTSLQELLKLYNAALEKFKKQQAVKAKEGKSIEEAPDPAASALTLVANVILNLDEVVTKN